MTAPQSSSGAVRRRLAGARAQGHGAGFERWLSMYIFRPLIERGYLLRADKLDAPMQAVRDRERGAVFVPVGLGGADFVLLGSSGRYFACECKTVDAGRLYRDEIPAHQVKHLDQTARSGAGSLLAVQFRDAGTSTAFLCPWQSVPWATARSAESITAADVEPWVIRGWLDAVRLVGGKP